MADTQHLNPGQKPLVHYRNHSVELRQNLGEQRSEVIWRISAIRGPNQMEIEVGVKWVLNTTLPEGMEDDGVEVDFTRGDYSHPDHPLYPSPDVPELEQVATLHGILEHVLPLSFGLMFWPANGEDKVKYMSILCFAKPERASVSRLVKAYLKSEQFKQLRQRYPQFRRFR